MNINKVNNPFIDGEKAPSSGGTGKLQDITIPFSGSSGPTGNTDKFNNNSGIGPAGGSFPESQPFGDYADSTFNSALQGAMGGILAADNPEQELQSLKQEKSNIESTADTNINNLTTELSEIISNAENVSQELKTQHENTQNDLTACESDINSKQSEISDCDRKSSSIDSEISSLEGQLGSYPTNTEDPEVNSANAAKIDSIKSKISNLKNQKQRVESQKKSFEEQKETLENTKKDLDSQLASIQQEIYKQSPELQQAMTAKQQEITTAKEQKTTDVQQIDAQIATAQKAFDEKKIKEKEALQAQRDEVEANGDEQVQDAQDDLYGYLGETNPDLLGLFKEFDALEAELKEKVDDPTNVDSQRMFEIESQMLELKNSNNPEDKEALKKLNDEYKKIKEDFEDYSGKYYIERYGDKKGRGTGIGDNIDDVKGQIAAALENTTDEDLKQKLITYYDAIDARATDLGKIDAQIAIKSQELVSGEELKLHERALKALEVGYKELNLGVTEDSGKDNGSEDNNRYLLATGKGCTDTAWCASFVSYMYATGQNSDNKDTFGNSIRVYRNQDNLVTLSKDYYSKEDEYKPGVGDIMIMNRNSRSHTGVITGTNYDGSVRALEGNAQNAVREMSYMPGTETYATIGGWIRQNQWLYDNDEKNKNNNIA